LKCYNAWWGNTSVERIASKVVFSGSLENSPNPFTSNTNIRYEISKSDQITPEIFDLTGNRVNVIVNQYSHPCAYQIN